MSNIIIAIATVAYVVLTAAVVAFMYSQVRAQHTAIKLQMFYLAVGRMEEIREHRHVLREYVRTFQCKHEKVTFPLPDQVRYAADKVCREFDLLGLMDRTGVVDSKLVDLFYAVPFALLYEDVLGQYVADLRKLESRGPTHFWELVQFYERVKNVPNKHPALTRKPDWPEDPRTDC